MHKNVWISLHQHNTNPSVELVLFGHTS